MGEVILLVAREYPEVKFLVLCGHTHGGGMHRPCENVVVYTAGAQYGRPEIAGFVVFRGGGLELEKPDI
jgi:predicted MPP superfamily phosphohydrolase